GVEDVHRIRVLRVREDVRVVPGALAQPPFVVRALPGGARVFAAVDAAVLRLDEGPHPARVRGGDGDAHAAPRPLGQAFARHFLPGVAAVRRLVEAAARPAALQAPGRAHHLPEGGVEDARVGGIHVDVDRARAVVDVEDLAPRA